MSQQAPPWESLRIVRSIYRLSFTNSKDNLFTEEIVLRNRGDEPIRDFPLPVGKYLHKLQISDESSILSWKSRDEILGILDTVDQETKLRLRSQLDYGNLLWVTLEEEREIKPQETRTIFIKHHFFGIIKNKEGSSFFSFPRYIVKGNTRGFPVIIYITCPAEFELKIIPERTCAFTEQDINRHTQKYHLDISENLYSYRTDLKNLILYSEDPDAINYEPGKAILFNKDSMVSFVIPHGYPKLEYVLTFEIEFPEDVKNRWKSAVILSIIALSTTLIIQLYTPIFSTYLGDNSSTTLAGLGTAFFAVIGSILTFTKNPMLRKTHYWLTIPIVLSVIIILLSGKS